MGAPFSFSVAINPIIKEELLKNRHNFHLSRRMLLHNPNLYSTPPPPPSPLSNPNTTFDANVVMVLSVLLCALICSLGLNSIIRCALRCSALVATPDSARLANTGIKKKALKTFPVISYSVDLKCPGLDTECAICLAEFVAGERVRVLPKCHHGFHVRCIDRWLSSHSSCPTCRHCLIHTCNKIIGSTDHPLSSQDVVITIQPLQREGLILNHQI